MTQPQLIVILSALFVLCVYLYAFARAWRKGDPDLARIFWGWVRMDAVAAGVILIIGMIIDALFVFACTPEFLPQARVYEVGLVGGVAAAFVGLSGAVGNIPSVSVVTAIALVAWLVV